MKKEYKVTAHFAWTNKTSHKFIEAYNATQAKEIAKGIFRNYSKLTAKESK